MEITGRCIVAPGDFQFVANTISIGIIQAVAVAIEQRIRVFACGQFFRTVARLLEINEYTVVARWGAVLEELDVHRARQIAVGRDLGQQHAEIVSGNAVCIPVEDEPAATDGVIDEQVISVFERIAPHIVRVVDGVDVAFAVTRRFCETNRDVRIKRSTWEKGK